MFYFAQADPNHSETSPVPQNWHRLKAASLREAAIKYLRRNPGIMKAYAPRVWIIVAEDAPTNKHNTGMPLWIEAFLLEW